MLDERWNAVEADFQRFYGIDLPAAVYGATPIGARRMWALVSELPPDSAVIRAESHGWRTEHELMASLIEVVDGGMRNLFVAALAPHTKKPPEPWKAVTVPRPGQPTIAPPPPESTSLQSLAAIRAAFLKGGTDG